MISRRERGEPPALGEQLFDRSVFKEALSIVSETRQNLIAKYPDLKDILAKLNGEKTGRPAALPDRSSLWCMASQALRRAGRWWRACGIWSAKAGRSCA